MIMISIGVLSTPAILSSELPSLPVFMQEFCWWCCLIEVDGWMSFTEDFLSVIEELVWWVFEDLVLVWVGWIFWLEQDGFISFVTVNVDVICWVWHFIVEDDDLGCKMLLDGFICLISVDFSVFTADGVNCVVDLVEDSLRISWELDDTISIDDVDFALCACEEVCWATIDFVDDGLINWELDDLISIYDVALCEEVCWVSTGFVNDNLTTLIVDEVGCNFVEEDCWELVDLLEDNAGTWPKIVEVENC